jgi:hypothetical protein
MESFCTDFKTFEEKLEDKGVTVSTRISMSPPIAEHATIINIDDYNINGVIPIKEIKEKAVEEKAVKPAVKKTFTREDN